MQTLRLLGITLCVSLVTSSVHSLEAPVAPDVTAQKAQGQTTVQVLPRDVALTAVAGSVFEPVYTSLLPVGARGDKIPVQTVKVVRGRVSASMSRAPSQRGILLQGPDKILGISTEGEMVLSVTEQEVAVGAVSGDVLVGKGTQFRALSSGTLRLFSRATGASRDVSLPAPPELSTSQTLSIALSGTARVPLTSDKTGPHTVVLRDAAGAVISSRSFAAEPFFVEVPTAGIYSVRAQVHGVHDIPSREGAEVRLQVLGLAPGQSPPNAGSEFVLGDQERVRLAGTEGLEVRYGTSPDFVPASPSIGLSQPRRTRVQFRNPKNHAETAELTLVPALSSASISITPTGARWPRDRIEVRVSLSDADGQEVYLIRGHQIAVSVNSTPVAVAFRETAAGLWGQVPAPGGPGPWVVRVRVSDKNGRPLARNFLEVVPQ